MDVKIKIEHSKLLFAFYKKAIIIALPFGAALAYLFFETIEFRFLLIWLFILIASCIGQFFFVSAIEKKAARNRNEYLYWTKTLNLLSIATGCQFAMAAIATMYLPANLYFLVCYFLVVSVTIISCCGFKDAFLAFATPILIGLAISGFIFFISQWYLNFLLVIVAALFITLSKYFENTLVESIRIRFDNDHLIDELGIKKAEAESANMAKSIFLASASHDLRQPLHALNFQLASFETHLDTNTQKELTKKMKRSLSTLNDLFDGILDISKIDSGITSPQFEDFNISECCSRLLDEFEQEATNKGLTLKFETQAVIVNSDLILLERILTNLISNAIKYTDHGEVKVETIINGDLVKININDTGQGIATNELEHIFDEFYQIDENKKTNTRGLGLGLFIVKRLCQLLNHELVVTSETGRGSKFSIILPLGDSSIVSKKQGLTEHQANLSNLSVMLIDDDIDIIEATEELLTRWGCEVSAAQNTTQAMRHIDNGVTPDIIVSDYSLADDVTGVEVIEKINRVCNLNVPSLLLTGDTSSQTLSDAISNGYIVLHKPVSPKLLRETISNLINV